MVNILRKLFSRNGNYNITDFASVDIEEECNAFLYDEKLADIEAPCPKRETSIETTKATEESMQALSSLKKLISENVQLITRYDTLANSSTVQEDKDLYQSIAFDIIEALILSGCTPINPQPGDLFDKSSHIPTPLCWPESAIVSRTVRMGVEFDDKIYVKALVEIKQ